MASRDSTEQAASDTEPTAIQDGNDYDGRDLREVVRQPGIEWPKDWPPQDHIPKIELGPVTLLSTDSANVLPADDFVAFKMGLRSVGMLTGTDVPLRKLANYTHFASVKEMLFYVHTIGAKHFSMYTQYRKLCRSQKRPSMFDIMNILAVTCFPAEPTAGAKRLYEQIDALQMPDVYEGPIDSTIGVAIIVSALSAMRADTERFSHGTLTDVPSHNFFGFHPEDWGRSLSLVGLFMKERNNSKGTYNLATSRGTGFGVAKIMFVDEKLAAMDVSALRAPADEDEAVAAADDAPPEEPELKGSKKQAADRMERLQQEINEVMDQAAKTWDADQKTQLKHKEWSLREDLYSTAVSLGTDRLPPLSQDDRAYLKELFLQIRGPAEDTSVEMLDITGGTSDNVLRHMESAENDYVPKVQPDGQDGLTEDVATVGDDYEEQLEAKAYAEKKKANYVETSRLMSEGNLFRYMPLTDAMEYLGIEDYKDARIDEANPHQTYRPHQIVDIAHIVRMLLGFPKFVMLANGCGTGKTITYCGAIDHLVRQKQKRYAEMLADPATGPPPPVIYRPVLLLLLATVTPSTCGEIQKYFGGKFRIYMAYGDKTDETNYARRESILTAKEVPKKMKSLDSSDPQTGRTVFVTSYHTWLRREAGSTTVRLSSLTEKQRDSLGLNDGIDGDLGDAPARRGRKLGRKLTSAEREICNTVEEDGEDGTLDIVTLSHPEYHFGIVIADEGHILRNPFTKFHQMVAAIEKDGFVVSTATPMLNHPADNLSYLRLGFSHLPALPEFPPDMDLNSLYSRDVDSYIAQMPIGSTGYNKIGGGRHPPISGMQSLLKAGCAPGTMEDTLMRAAEEEDLMWWTLSPVLYRMAARQHHWSYDSCKTMIGSLIRQVYPRRMMTTEMELPDGTITTPGSDIPGAEIITRQISLHGPGAVLYSDVHHHFKDQLYVPMTGTKGKPSTGEKSNKVTINGGVWRRLDVMAVNPNNFLPLELDVQIASEGGPSCRPRGEADLSPAYDSEDDTRRARENAEAKEAKAKEAKAKGGKAKGGKAATSADDVQAEELALSQTDIGPATPKFSAPASEADDLADKTEEPKPKEEKTPAIMGVETVELLIRSTKDGGAAFMFKKTVEDPRMEPPVDRVSFIRYLTSRSPALAAVLHQILEWIDAEVDETGLPNRVFVAMDSPCNQQELCTLLDLLGVRYISMRAADDAESRAEKVARFNDPDDSEGVQVFVTNYRIGAVGFDFHVCCSKGIVLGWPWSANLLNQLLGRLSRIGQKRFVTWVVFCVMGTIHEKHEMIIWPKYVRQLAAESKVPEDIWGEFGIIVMYELVRVMFNQLFSRYLFEVIDFDVGIFMDQKARQLCETVSKLARLVLKQPKRFSALYAKPRIDVVSMIFKLTQELQDGKTSGEETPELTPEHLLELCNADGWKAEPDTLPSTAQNSIEKKLSSHQIAEDRAQAAKAQRDRQQAKLDEQRQKADDKAAREAYALERTLAKASAGQRARSARKMASRRTADSLRTPSRRPGRMATIADAPTASSQDGSSDHSPDESRDNTDDGDAKASDDEGI